MMDEIEYFDKDTEFDDRNIKEVASVDGIIYEFNYDGTAAISAYNNEMIGKNLKIPERVQDSDGNLYRVTKIDDFAFIQFEELEKADIPDSVLKIGEGAFINCENLRTVRLPKCITELKEGVFSGCTNLQNIVIPENVTSIGDNAFNDCEKLTDLVLPEKLQRIGERAFANCENLKSIFVPQFVESIGENAFGCCDNPINVVVDNANTKYKVDGHCLIELDTNKVLQGDKNSVIPDYVKEIENGAFAYCKGLENIRLPQGLTKIGEDAFALCFDLKEVFIPSSVVEIGENAFESCSAKLICDFESRPDSWTEDIGVDGKYFVWNLKKSGIFQKLKDKLSKKK